MPANSPIPLPGDALMEWRAKYPEAADELIRTVNLLLAMRVQLVTANSNNTTAAILTSPTEYLLSLALRFRAPIADSSATAASVSTQLNLLLAELRVTKQLPS